MVLAFKVPYKWKFTEFAIGKSGRCDRAFAVTFWKGMAQTYMERLSS